MQARDALLENGDDEMAAQAEAFLSRVAWLRGQGPEARGHIERAEELVANAGPTVAKARVLCLSARLLMLSSEEDEAIRTGHEALALAEALDLDELRIHALTSIGTAKAWLDHTGHAELERALEIARSINSPLAASVLNNLAVVNTQSGDIPRAEELNMATLETAKLFGDRDNVRFSRGNLLYNWLFRGRWDEALEEADRFIAECETSSHNMETAAREVRAEIRFARGDAEGACEDFERGLALARALQNPTRVVPALLRYGRGLTLLGRTDEARPLVVEGIELARETPSVGGLVGNIATDAWKLGLTEEVLEVLELAPDDPWKEGALAEVRGEGTRAADLYRGMGAPSIEADVRFGTAEALIAKGRTAEGRVELENALAFYRSVGATFFVHRGEALLAQAATG